jgi:predicted nucleotidyltransferase
MARSGKGRHMDERLKDDIIKTLLEFVDMDSSLIFLFGSLATHTERTHSDIDIGYLGTRKLSFSTVAGIRDCLDEKVRTLRKIDFVDFTDVHDEVFRHEAARGAIEWYRGKDCSISLDCLKKYMAG